MQKYGWQYDYITVGVLYKCDPIVLQNSICKILKVVVELGGDTVDALLHHGVHQAVQLVLRQVEVEPVLHGLDRTGGVVEAGQLRAGPDNISVRDVL